MGLSFSSPVVLRAFGRSLRLLLLLLGAFLAPLEASEVLWGSVGISPAAPSCDFVLLTRPSELLRLRFTSSRGFGRRFGTSLGALRCDFEVRSFVFGYHWSFVTRQSPFVSRHSSLVVAFHFSFFLHHHSSFDAVASFFALVFCVFLPSFQ